MRVISGDLGGQQFDSPDNKKTHPMSDKIRGALFNSLGDISSLTFLDAFGGSGGISYEALSRGASEGVIVDLDREAQQTIEKNLKKLNITHQLRLQKMSLTKWLENFNGDGFDIIFADPPYDNLQPTLIERLCNVLKKNGIMIVSWPVKTSLPEFIGLDLVKQKTYGDAQLAFYRQLS